MSREVRWTPSARAELLAIIAFITRENPAAAFRMLRRIEASAASLGAFATGRKGRVPETFEKIVARTPYILAYALISPAGQPEQVAIVHVIHGARDWPPGGWPGS